jgi:GAF domain-containing protein
MAEVTTLYVDPNATASTSPLRDLIQDSDIKVYRETSVDEATAFLENNVVDCVVTEYDLPDGTGTELVSAIREIAPDTGTILVTDAPQAQISDGSSVSLVTEFVPKNASEVGPRVVQLVKSTAANRSQTSYPLPASEQARLKALETYDLDDERLVRAVQRITDLAADHFVVPQSSVNIVTERTQEFLACTGASWETTAREESICTYTILREGVSVVEDTSTDPRFADNDNLDEEKIRFYAGATLTTGEGYPVGTLCVYDDEPRVFSEADRVYLSLLAAEVMDWLEVARQPRETPDFDPVNGGAS